MLQKILHTTPLMSSVFALGFTAVKLHVCGSPLRRFFSSSIGVRCEVATTRKPQDQVFPKQPVWSLVDLSAIDQYRTTPSDVFEDLARDKIVNFIPPDIDLRDASASKCILYQYESCPFCCKTRVCLDYLKIPYEIVEVHPVSKKELRELTEYRKVPVLVIKSTKGDAPPIMLKDSKRIVHALFCHEGLVSEEPVNEQRQRMIEWIRWSDEILVQLVVMNIYRSLTESMQTFNYLLTHPKFSLMEKHSARLAGCLIMWLVSKRRKAKYQVADERKALYAALNQFFDAKGPNVFLGGDKPNQADIAMYGIIRSIEGFDAERDVFANTKILEWVKSMRQLCQDHSLRDTSLGSGEHTQPKRVSFFHEAK